MCVWAYSDVAQRQHLWHWGSRSDIYKSILYIGHCKNQVLKSIQSCKFIKNLKIACLDFILYIAWHVWSKFLIFPLHDHHVCVMWYPISYSLYNILHRMLHTCLVNYKPHRGLWSYFWLVGSWVSAGLYYIKECILVLVVTDVLSFDRRYVSRLCFWGLLVMFLSL